MLGHNLWLVTRNKKNRKVRVEVNTSDTFPASDSAVRSERIADFRLVTPNGSRAITHYAAEENSLVAEVEILDAAPFYVALELRPHPITLAAEKFAHYIADEDAEKFAPDEVTAPQRESYAKFAKSFYQTKGEQTNGVFNLTLGQRFEIVPQTPFLEVGENAKIKVLVLFEGKPMKNLRVSFGGENLNNGNYVAHARTNADGTAEIEIGAASELCFLRTHFIRPHTDAENFEWESFWASLTFDFSQI